MKKLSLKVQLPVVIFKEGKSFVAYTPALDLSTCGDSFEETKKRFGEAVNLFFDELIKEDTIDEVLRDLGWQKKRKKWSPPIVIAHDTEEVKIPQGA